MIYNCRVQLTHQDELIQVRIHYPVLARDPKIRPFVAEALARANHGMSIGNFDIDMDTGDINFHLGQVIRGNGLDDEIIGGVFSAGLATADRYFPAIMRVMFAGHTPTDAVYLSELDVHAEAVEAGEGKSPSTPNPPKRVAKRPKAPRKDSRPRQPRTFQDYSTSAPTKATEDPNASRAGGSAPLRIRANRSRRDISGMTRKLVSTRKSRA